MNSSDLVVFALIVIGAGATAVFGLSLWHYLDADDDQDRPIDRPRDDDLGKL